MSRKQRIVIGTGGTGGHVLPAQSLARKLLEFDNSLEILFLGNGLDKNKFFKKETFTFQDIPSGKIVKNPFLFVRSCFRIIRGVKKSCEILRKFDPDLVIGFGSYHSFPVLAASSILSIPFILHAADCIPGRVNRFFAKRASWTGVFFPEAMQYLNGKTEVVSIPLRKNLEESFHPSNEEARAYFGFSNDRKTLLIFGGSQGAHSLNEYAKQVILRIVDHHLVNIVHYTGSKESSLLLDSFYKKHGIEAVVKEFENNMHFAWKIADLVISRAGASTIAEQLAFQVPALYIPYPFAQDGHQLRNAKCMERMIQSKCVLEEHEITTESLFKDLNRMLACDSLRIMKTKLKDHATQLVRKDFSEAIFDQLRKGMGKKTP